MDVPWASRLVIGFFRAVVGLYFRRVETSGLQHVPPTGGGILVAWHPNGLVDPGLILSRFPRRVVFGARHGLFAIPVFGQAMRAIGTVPIYRARDLDDLDPEERRAANRRSLAALAEAVAEGSFSCLFPEGTSHDAPHPVEIKRGAAHLYYQARCEAEGEAPVILPVGLHYDHKRLFRTEAHVVFHPPLDLPAGLDVTPDDPAQERELARQLTEEIERALHDVAHATADWETHFLIRRVRKLVRAERAARAGRDLGRPTMRERTMGFARVWRGFGELQRARPAEVEALRERIEAYDADMQALGLDDHQLDQDPRLLSPALAILVGLQAITVFFLLPPLILVGYLINLPTAALLWLFTRGVARKHKDEATLKVLLGAVLFPLTWVVAGIGAWWAHQALQGVFPGLPETAALSGLLVALLGAIGGAVALRYVELARETARAVRVRLVKSRWRQVVEDLRAERTALYERVMELARGLELPGSVAIDGRILEHPEEPDEPLF